MNTPQLITPNLANGRLLDTPLLNTLVESYATLNGNHHTESELIRNLSSIITDRLNSMNNDGEKSFDLSDIVLREQSKQKLNKSPSIDESKDKPMFASLNPVDLRTTIQNSNEPKFNTDNNYTASSIHNQDSDSISTESTMDESQDSNSKNNSFKRALSSSENKAPQPAKRGRKPLNTNINKSNTNSSSQHPKKLTKKERLLQEAKNPVCFGNKVVEKGTEEYDKRRHNNNLAVKLCRLKQAENQKKREETMKTLEDENKRLTQKVQKLTQELTCLKEVIHSMNPKKLPSNISELINRVESS
jgi:hypothetical protein